MAINQYFENIADAIRERADTSGVITPAGMPQAIRDIPGGGGGAGILYEWDFTKSSTDLNCGIDVVLTGCVQTSDGLHFTAASQNCQLPYLYIPGISIEIEFGAINYGGSSSNHTSILMIGNPDSSNGLLRRSTGKLSWFYSSWTDIANMSSINELANKKLKVVIKESTVDTYIDSVLLGSTGRNNVSVTYSRLNIGNTRGASSGGNFYDVYVKNCIVKAEDLS